MSSNISKTDIIIIKHKQTIVSKLLIFRVRVQTVNTTNSVKYLNDSLTWEKHFKNLITKFNRTIEPLSKVRHCTPKFPFKAIYNFFFN